MGFELSVIIPVAALLISRIAMSPGEFSEPELIAWIVIVATVELLPVSVWRDVQLTMGFPLLMAVAVLYSPPAAAGVALLGSFDPRELRGEISIVRAAFNRCQIAVSVGAASWVFHSIGSADSSVPVLVGGALAAVVADYVLNVSLVTAAGCILYRLPPAQVLQRVKIGRPRDFLITYLGLGALGVILALLHKEVGFWSVATFIAPLVFARQMFFRSRALEEAHQELKQREQVLQALSNRMAEERQDERAQIAAYLHDDLAQLLFRLSLQVDVAKRHLRMKDIESLGDDLEAIRGTKNQTSDLIRVLIRDLHRSPLGRAGLKEALASFVEDVGQGLGVEFHTEIEDLPLSPPIQLLVYQIAREAVMNSLRHSGASDVWITLRSEEAVVELVLRDNGSGFDVDTPGSEDHFGLAMMRERALVAGGTFDLSSPPGQGTTVTVRFPASWLQEGEAEEPAPPAPPAEAEHPGSPEPAPPAAQPVSA